MNDDAAMFLYWERFVAFVFPSQCSSIPCEALYTLERFGDVTTLLPTRMWSGCWVGVWAVNAAGIVVVYGGREDCKDKVVQALTNEVDGRRVAARLPLEGLCIVDPKCGVVAPHGQSESSSFIKFGRAVEEQYQGVLKEKLLAKLSEKRVTTVQSFIHAVEGSLFDEGLGAMVLDAADSVVYAMLGGGLKMSSFVPLRLDFPMPDPLLIRMFSGSGGVLHGLRNGPSTDASTSGVVVNETSNQELWELALQACLQSASKFSLAMKRFTSGVEFIMVGWNEALPEPFKPTAPFIGLEALLLSLESADEVDRLLRYVPELANYQSVQNYWDPRIEITCTLGKSIHLCKSEAFIRALLEAGADPTWHSYQASQEGDMESETMISAAIERSNIDLFFLLLQFGAKLSPIDLKVGFSSHVHSFFFSLIYRTQKPSFLLEMQHRHAMRAAHQLLLIWRLRRDNIVGSLPRDIVRLVAKIVAHSFQDGVWEKLVLQDLKNYLT